jgi:predicted MFS family arabinose efflux permease
MFYRELARSSGLWFLLLGLAARLPYAMLPLATLLWLRGGGVSFTQAGGVAAAQSVAIAVGGLTVGRLADRYGPRRVGFVAALLNAVAVAVMIFVGPQAWIVAVLAGLTQPQVGPLARMHWALSRPDLLPVALSFEAAADELSFVVGPVIAELGLLLLLVLLVGAAVPFALRYDRGRLAPVVGGVVAWRSIAVLVGAMVGVGAIFGAVQTGVTAVGSAGLYALLGVGSAVGGLMGGWIRVSVRVSAVALVVGMATFVVLPLPVAMVVDGATIAPFMVTLFVAAERGASGRLGVVIATLSAGGPVGTAVGQLIGGWMTDRYGLGGAFVVAPVAAVVVCCVVIVL